MYNKVTDRGGTMAKNKARKLKRYKRKNISQLIKIIARQDEKQDKLLQRVEELEEYINFIEGDAENLAFKDTSFDALTISMLFNRWRI